MIYNILQNKYDIYIHKFLDISEDYISNIYILYNLSKKIVINSKFTNRWIDSRTERES